MTTKNKQTNKQKKLRLRFVLMAFHDHWVLCPSNTPPLKGSDLCRCPAPLILWLLPPSRPSPAVLLSVIKSDSSAFGRGSVVVGWVGGEGMEGERCCCWYNTPGREPTAWLFYSKVLSSRRLIVCKQHFLNSPRTPTHTLTLRRVPPPSLQRHRSLQLLFEKFSYLFYCNNETESQHVTVTQPLSLS